MLSWLTCVLVCRVFEALGQRARIVALDDRHSVGLLERASTKQEPQGFSTTMLAGWLPLLEEKLQALLGYVLASNRVCQAPGICCVPGKVKCLQGADQAQYKMDSSCSYP